MTSGQKWSPADQALLVEAVATDKDLGAVAASLGRTRDAVYRRAVATGLVEPRERTIAPRRRPYHELFGD